MACIPAINISGIDDEPANPTIPCITFDSSDQGSECSSSSTTTINNEVQTSLTTVRITPESLDVEPVPGERGPRRRKSVVEIENTTITESFALVPKPLLDEGGLIVPPVSNRRRISVAQWRDINASLFDKRIRFEDTAKEDDDKTTLKCSFPTIRRIEDTFWLSKRALIPDYSCMEELDQRAINGPGVPIDDITSLVSDLTSSVDGDLSKFRVLFRWISHNISYDTNFLDTGERPDQSPSTVLRTGEAVCEGFSQLLCEMCNLAGITCESVIGVSKAIGFSPGATEYLRDQGRHAWNMVHIGDQLFPCDSAWAAGISNRGTDGHYKFERRWGEGYFLANPDQFSASHFPMPEGAEPELDTWSSSIQVGRAAFLFELTCLSHETGVIHVKDNRVLIRIKSAFPLDSFCYLTEGDHTGRRIPQCVLQWWDGNVLHCDISLPQAGRYVFAACGMLPNGQEAPSASSLASVVSNLYGTRLMTFTIVAEGTEPPITPSVTSSDNNEVWGVDPRFIQKGFSPISHVGPYVDATDGRASLSFQQIGDIIPLIPQFSRLDDPDVNLEEYVYMETVAQRLVCHLSCPTAGKYLLSLKMKQKDAKYHRAAAYIVSSTREFEGKDDAPVAFPKGHSGIWGPNDTFFEMGLTVRGPDSSTILATNGECYFVIRCDKSPNLEMNLTLQSSGSKEELRNGHAFIQSARGKNTTTASISLRLSEAGMYELKVFARIKPGTEKTYVGSWMVVCEVPSWKSLFPKGSVICGPTEEFSNHGLATDQEALVETDAGESMIEITLTQEIFLTFSLKIGDTEKDTHQGKVFSELMKREGTSLAIFNFRLHETGLFAFRLFVKKTPKQEKATYVGMWLIDCHEVSSKDPYPPRSGLWGPNQVFHSAGMTLVDLDSSYIKLHDGTGQLSIKHSSQRSAKKMTYRLDKDGKKYDATRIINAETRWSSTSSTEVVTTLHFRFDQRGMFALLLFDGSKQSNAFAGHWLIDCRQPTELPPFPEHSGMWGPSENFQKMGMQAENMESSIIVTDEAGECQLDISGSLIFTASFHLFEGIKSNRLPKDHLTLNYTNNGRHTVECRVKLPHCGAFGLQFYAAEKGNKKLNSCGIWLIIWR